jgi:murein L,D-transpeptidase YcbB/YkuD
VRDHAANEVILVKFGRAEHRPRQTRLVGGQIAAIVAILALMTAGTAAAVPQDAPAVLVPASLQPADAAAAANPANAGNSEIRNRIESATGLVVAGEKLHGALLRSFYATHNYEPVWPSHQAQANALLGAIMRAGDQGLDPDLFHRALLRNQAALPPVDRELLLSDAFLAYADALARGALPVEDRMDDEDLTPGPVDVAAALDQALNSPDPAAVIEALAPQSPAYLALRRALQAYRTAPAARNGDGRVRDIEVNLERLRWLPRQLPPDRVWVNLASARLVLYRDNQPAFTTRVVVGEVDKQTPEFETTIDSVLFNPPWNVPSSIASEEILPKLSRDPKYLSRHHMVVRHGGAIQQQAGPYSALGRLKFEMTDRFDVYLHDTPEKLLFKRDDRRRSHGCVRVQDPRELASLLLQEPVEAVNKGVDLSYTNRHMLSVPMPVFLVYQTAVAEPDGTLAFFPDVYQRDAEIGQRLHPERQAPVAEHIPGAQPRG